MFGLGNILGDLKTHQEEMAKKTVEITSGGVKLVMNGAQEILSITIDPTLLETKDQIMLQDLVRAAVNDGIKASRDIAAEAMKKWPKNQDVGKPIF